MTDATATVDPAVAGRLRLLLCEDSFLVREGILRALEAMPALQVAAVCSDAEAARSAIADAAPDIVLTDIRLPPGHSDEGIRLAVDLETSHPDVAVLVLSQHAQPVYAEVLFRRASSRRGYLLKDRVADRDELERALRTVAAGGWLMDERIAGLMFAARTTAMAALTEREREALALLAAAHSNGVIAGRLGVSARAAERLVADIFAKLGPLDAADVSQRVLATRRFLEHHGGLPVAAPGAASD